MIRIECKCRTCKTHAVQMGRSGPLAALVPVALAPVAKTAAGRHGLVHMAHDPNAVTGAAARARTNVQAD